MKLFSTNQNPTRPHGPPVTSPTPLVMLCALSKYYSSLCRSTILASALLLSLVPSTFPSSACGGLLQNTSGILVTPRFPSAFPVPLRCTWTIENRDASSVIVLYFTQLYVTSGLTVTDYSILIAPWSDPTVLFESNEKSSLETQWVSTPKQFMVVDFQLESLFGTHIRALDNLLDVYGFNITYEVASAHETGAEVARPDTSDASDGGGETLAPPSGEQEEDLAPSGVREQLCSVVDCSFSGHCYANANFTAYECACFDGFSGPNCGDGPLCQGGQNVCENGARCRHAGATHILCVCPEGFTGVRCETLMSKPSDSDCADVDLSCSDTGSSRYLCPHTNDSDVTPCKCGNQAVPVPFDKSRYEVRLALDTTDSNRTALTLSLNRTVAKLFRGIAKIENLQILNMTSHRDIWFHFYGAKSDRDKIHMTLLKLLGRSSIGSFSFLSKEFGFNQEPMIQNKAILVNQKQNRVREGKEFILSCVAEGSRFITFRWYKDDALVNVNYSMREMWSKRSERDSAGQYTATLGIQSAHKLDQGRFTCQVIDLGYQQCRSLELEVVSAPEVKISPLSVTLTRGSNLTIKCMSPDERNFGNSSDKFGYSWIRDGELFPMNPDSEIWEDLEPGGSVLRVVNVQRSATYSCLVTAPNVSPSLASSSLHIIEASRHTPLCAASSSYGLSWPATLNGETAFVESLLGRCTVSRACTLASTASSVDPALWEIEDFSACVPPTLYTIETNFQSLRLGYQTTSINLTLLHTAEYMASGHQRYPGQTESAVTLLSNILRFIQHTTRTSLDFVSSSGILGASEYFYAIVNYLLHWDQPLPSFVHRQKVIELQAIIEVWSLLWCNQLSGDHKRLLLDSLLIDVRKLYNLTTSYVSVQQPSVQFKNTASSWSPNTSISFESSSVVLGSKQALNVVIIAFANLTQYLSPRYVNKETDVVYEVHSGVVSTCLGDGGVKLPMKEQRTVRKLKIIIEFSRPKNESIPAGWNLTCGTSEDGGDSWLLIHCHTQLLRYSVVCTCTRPGLHSLLITLDKNKTSLARHRVSHVPVMVGYSSCILEVAFTLLHILPRLFRRRSCFLLLKVISYLLLLILMMLLAYQAYQSHLDKAKTISYLLLLQYLVFAALSCELSGLLIIYTEVMFHPGHPKETRLPIFFILHALSLLIILSLSLSSSHASLVYYLCVIFTCVFVLAFTCLCVHVGRYVRELCADIRDKRVLFALTLRQYILNHSSVLVFFLSLTYACVILHLSHPSSLLLQYSLALASCSLGFSLCFVYYSQYHKLAISSDEILHSSDGDLSGGSLLHTLAAPGDRVAGTEGIPLTESSGSGGGRMVTFNHDLVGDSRPPDLSAPPLSPSSGCDALDILPSNVLPQPKEPNPLTTHVCVELRPCQSHSDNRPQKLSQNNGPQNVPQNKAPQHLLCSADIEPGTNSQISLAPPYGKPVPSHPTLISFCNSVPLGTPYVPSVPRVPYSSSSNPSHYNTARTSQIPYDGFPYTLDPNDTNPTRDSPAIPSLIPYEYPYTPVSNTPCTVLNAEANYLDSSQNCHTNNDDSHRKSLDRAAKPSSSGYSSFKMNSLPRQGSNSQIVGGTGVVSTNSRSNSQDLTCIEKALDFRETCDPNNQHAKHHPNTLHSAQNNHIQRSNHSSQGSLNSSPKTLSRNITPDRSSDQFSTTLDKQNQGKPPPSLQNQGHTVLNKPNKIENCARQVHPFVNSINTQNPLDNVSPCVNTCDSRNCQSKNCATSIAKFNVNSSVISAPSHTSQPNNCSTLETNPCINNSINPTQLIKKSENSQLNYNDPSILVSSEALTQMASNRSVSSLIVDGVRIDEINRGVPKSTNDPIESLADSTCTDSSDSAIADVDSNPNDSSENSAMNDGGELLNQISQDLDYLLNCPREDFSSLKRRRQSALSSPGRISRNAAQRHAASSNGESCGNYVPSPSKLVGNKDSINRIS